MPKQEIVLAIIRQESEFDRKANSWAGLGNDAINEVYC